MVGPLATYAEPHCYDLCQMHSDRLTAPKGWEVVRITPDPDALKPTTDDLEALANAVREAAKPRHDIAETERGDATAETTPQPTGGRRSHLRVVPDVSAAEFTPREKREPETREPEKRHDDAHPVFAPRPKAPSPDEPFDHEGLW